MGDHRKARRRDDGTASTAGSANGLPPERAAALLAELDRIAAATGFRHGGVTRWEAFEAAAGLNRGALWGARQGSRTQPETLAALARWFGESPASGWVRSIHRQRGLQGQPVLLDGRGPLSGRALR